MIDWTDGRVIVHRHEDPAQELVLLAEQLESMLLDGADPGWDEVAAVSSIADELRELHALGADPYDLAAAAELVREAGSLLFPNAPGPLVRDEDGDWRFVPWKMEA